MEERWVAADDPVLVPLLEDLARDYDARYAPTDGVPSSAELTRYPPEVFAPALGGAFLAVLDDGELVAGGALKRGGPGRDGRPLAEVKRMWVHPARRRLGLAGLVLAELERRAAELGYTGLELTTGARQPEAVALYLRHAWAPDFDPAVPQDEAAYLRFTKPAPPPDRGAAGGATGRATTGLE
ncbi:GNAT family N-acetyltransferase [Amnibacterium kyonggiense]